MGDNQSSLVFARETRSRPTIGLIISAVYEEVPRAMWRGVADAAREKEANLICFTGGSLHVPVGSWQQDNVLYKFVDPKRIDALIIMSSSIGFAVDREEMTQFIQQYNTLPVVSLEERFEGIPSVLKDDYHGMREVIGHLIKVHGRRRIVFMRGPASFMGAKERYRAYIETLAEFNLPFDPNLVTSPPTSWNLSEAKELFQTFLEEHALRPRYDFDAVVAVNDESAFSVIEVLQEQEIRVPDDVAVAGFDDLEAAGVSAPPLTTIRPPFYAMGRQAVELLLARLQGKDIPDCIVVPAHLIVRRSCGCLLPTITQATAMPELTLQPSIQELKQLSPPGIKKGLAETLATERSTILAVMAQSVSAYPLGFQRVGQLLNGFISEIEHGISNAFLSVLDEILGQAAAQGEPVEDWQGVLSALRRLVLPYLNEAKALSMADNLWHQARVMVSEMAWRAQARRRLKSEELEHDLRVLSATLTISLDMVELMGALTHELPRLGIPRCYLSLYEDPANPAKLARLVLGYDEKGMVRLPPEKSIFPSHLLLPDEIFSYLDVYSLLVEALYFRDEPLGFVLFETGEPGERLEGRLYDALRVQISSAVKAGLLHREAQTARKEAVEGWRLAEEARRAAEQANDLKSRFLSMVSHELRTPLNVIAGLSENLVEEKVDGKPILPESSLRDLERIHLSAQHLDSLIRDVLDLASSHVGQLKTVCEPLDVGEALKPVLAMGERLARDKGLAWYVDIPEYLPRIFWDRTRLRQVVLNLISNAVKFTEEGSVSLRVTAKTGKIVITISDTGLGIPKEEQKTIFKEFQQSERTTVRGYGGLGLGLAICQRLVEQINGEIGVESSGELGGGSKFHIILPVMDERIDEQAVRQRAQTVLLLTGQTDENGQLYQRLSQRGFDVEEIRINQQKDWLNQIMNSPPGAIILDFESAQEQGLEILNVLKSNVSMQEVPVLFYTLYKGSNNGAVFEMDYLEKPLGRTRLIRALERHGLVKGQIQDKKTILIVDDEENIFDIHKRMVKSQLPGSQVLQAHNGREALAIMQRKLPDLVLLDLMMPEMDGFTVLHEMRKSDLMRGIPVIVLTSQKLSENEMEKLNQGVAAVLEKGLFSAEETLAQVEAVLARNKRLGSEARRIARQAMAYIHDHYKETISRKNLATHIGVSQEYLSTCFRRETGVTPISYLDRYRVNQARKLLETTEQSITEVAMEVGFGDSSYFGRVFRREVGVSPNAYRRGERLQLTTL